MRVLGLRQFFRDFLNCLGQVFWTCEGQFWGWGYFGLARDNFGAGAILDLRGTILGLGLFWTLEGQFWGWGYFGLWRDRARARARARAKG